MKKCKWCKETKSYDSFYKNKMNKDGHNNQCKTCRTEWAKEHYKNPEVKQRAIHNRLKRLYGMSYDDYFSLLGKQGNVCAICEKDYKIKDPKATVKSLMPVDHCHDSGKVRGILCVNCNHLLGKAKDNIELLKKAIRYLKDE